MGGLEVGSAVADERERRALGVRGLDLGQDVDLAAGARERRGLVEPGVATVLVEVHVHGVDLFDAELLGEDPDRRQ